MRSVIRKCADMPSVCDLNFVMIGIQASYVHENHAGLIVDATWDRLRK